MAGFSDQVTDAKVLDDAKESDAAVSTPATPSKSTDDSSITRTKRSISESEVPTVAKVMKV